MTYRIRRVDHEDEEIVDLLRDLHERTFIDGTHRPEWEGNWYGHWWIAYLDREAVGFCGLVESNQGPRTGYLCRVGVLAAHRGHGLQKKMMAVAERKAKSLGWERIVSDTTQNPPSANSFIARGFKTYLPKQPWSFDAAIYWRKELT